MKYGKNLTDNSPYDEFICSECGFAMEDFARMWIDDDGERTYGQFEVKYCPNCGTKIEVDE